MTKIQLTKYGSRMTFRHPEPQKKTSKADLIQTLIIGFAFAYFTGHLIVHLING